MPSDAVFAGAIPATYDRYLGPMFAPHAEQMVARLPDLREGALLEIAAGTGIVTAMLARALPPAVAITASDLNQPMLDFAAAKPGLERVVWRQADAMQLPFPDESFDAVVCQFGVMFFPDKPRAHAEVRRVLRPGGRYLFNVWDVIATNEITLVIEERLAALYPERPPRFMSRTPYGYNDPRTIQEHLRAGAFMSGTIDIIRAEWRPPTPAEPAIGITQGTPLRAEIEEAQPGGLAAATEAATAALAERFGHNPVGRTQSLLVTTTK
jgi:SAM-dependent methyltransferase